MCHVVVVLACVIEGQCEGGLTRRCVAQAQLYAADEALEVRDDALAHPRPPKAEQEYTHLAVLDLEATCDDRKGFSPMEIIEFPVRAAGPVCLCGGLWYFVFAVLSA